MPRYRKMKMHARKEVEVRQGMTKVVGLEESQPLGEGGQSKVFLIRSPGRIQERLTRRGKPKRVSALLLLGLASAFSATVAQIPGNASGASGAPAGQGEIKDKYHAVQVDQFEVKKDVEFPPDYLKKLQEEISKQLVDAKLFAEVLQPRQHPAHAEAPVIRLSGTIHNNKQGSRK